MGSDRVGLEGDEVCGQGRRDGIVLALLDAAAVPAGRIYTAADIAADPHYQARGMLVPIRQADGSTLTLPVIVPKLSRTPGSHRRDAPALGEHTAEVLQAPLAAAGIAVHLIGGALEAGELDAKRAIGQGTRLAASL